ncbi:MAG TPA: TRAP transporter substrate-binding protein [Rubrivivax sp.]|nr:TRAP transporter substrate-binding protein [Rubrivivax sp.]
MKPTRSLMLASCAALLFGNAAAQEEVTLRIHHFLPPQATIQAQVFEPWCAKINLESSGKIKCQLYPSMQLGGTPPQLFDQAKDGVADIIWTVPTYQAGRFIKAEVFELPFMAKSAEAGSPALYEYVQKNALDEFRGVKILAMHLHDGALLHFAKQPVKTLEDMKNLKVRAPTRIGAKVLTALGATPVQMPLPQVPESVAKGVIDGAMVPWEGVPPIKLQEIAKFHTDTAIGAPRMSNTIFVIAMNPDKYKKLPVDVQQVIDRNSGLEWSKLIGRAFDKTTEPAKKLAAAAGGTFDTLAPAEYERWVKQTEGVNKEWIGDVSAKGANGQALLDDARSLIKKFGG